MTFKQQVMAVAVAGAMGFALSSIAMTKAELKTENERISAEFKAAKAKCDGLKANAKDICMAEAKGANKVAKADLEARDKNTTKARFDLNIARAEADYAVAKEKCDDLSGNAKDVCVKDAKAMQAAAKADAKVDKTADNAQGKANQKIAEVRQEANEDKRDANYAAAKERCDSYKGDVKDRCIAEAKVRFNMK